MYRKRRGIFVNQYLLLLREDPNTGICVADKPFLQDLIVKMLSERREVQMGEDSFGVCYHLGFCMNIQETGEEVGETVHSMKCG